MGFSLPAGTTISHYGIDSLLGAGGMVEVYLAEDTRLDRKVALKLLPAKAWVKGSVVVREGATAWPRPHSS